MSFAIRALGLLASSYVPLMIVEFWGGTIQTAKVSGPPASNKLVVWN